MKKKFKNYLKLGVLLFGITFALTNCEREESFIDTEVRKEKKLNRISLSQLENLINKNETYSKLSSFYDVNKKIVLSKE